MITPVARYQNITAAVRYSSVSRYGADATESRPWTFQYDSDVMVRWASEGPLIEPHDADKR